MRLQISRGLERLRERAGLTQIELAERTGFSRATVSRYEDWSDRRKVKWGTVRTLAEACGATAEERDALIEMAKSQDAGWWVRNPAVPEILNPLVSFEAAAEYERVTSTTLVPGLLQTREYARALLRAQGVHDDDRLEQEAEARMKRQEILDRGLRYWAVLDEVVLRRVVGNDRIMADQLGHLCEMAQRPTVDIQVLPFRAGPPSAPGQFLILGRDDERDPRNSMAVVYLELPRRGVYLDDPDDVTAYKNMFDRLRAQAAGPDETAQLLNTVRQEYIR
ncbi:helix-turn-helix transcriptional regulator [Streptomyces sp. NPDC127098]|uniref:helix-turn-helix domain-containing protein n=1 Tax=Streptomyces sp. NPDC127098 TaxID=3347137 RepID=UPI00364B3E90